MSPGMLARLAFSPWPLRRALQTTQFMARGVASVAPPTRHSFCRACARQQRDCPRARDACATQGVGGNHLGGPGRPAATATHSGTAWPSVRVHAPHRLSQQDRESRRHHCRHLHHRARVIIAAIMRRHHCRHHLSLPSSSLPFSLPPSCASSDEASYPQGHSSREFHAHPCLSLQGSSLASA